MRRHLTFANVAAALAMFLALGGTAVAAKHYLITNTNQISPSVLRQLHGANGHNGANGSPGPAGPAGAPGAQGPAGPSNLSGIQIAYSPISYTPSKEVGSAIAFCPPGTAAVSGGGMATIATIVSDESEPTRAGWYIITLNEFSTPQETFAEVLCAGKGQAVAASTRLAERKQMEQHVAALVAKVRAEKAAAGR